MHHKIQMWLMNDYLQWMNGSFEMIRERGAISYTEFEVVELIGSNCCPFIFISFKLRALSVLGRCDLSSSVDGTLPISLRTLQRLMVKSTAPDMRACRLENAGPNSSGWTTVVVSTVSSGSVVGMSLGDGNAWHNSSGLKCSGKWSMRSWVYNSMY